MIDLHNALIAGRMLGGSGSSPAPQPTLITKNITANGNYSAAADNADGYSTVTVNVPEKTLTTKTITVNGTYNASSDNVDGYSAVSVAVPPSTLITKNITANGTYNASSDNADGYSAVTVNVEGGLPVTLLKSIKSLGNSIIVTDFVPSYDWIMLADVIIGNAVSGGSSGGYILGSMSYTNSENTGAYSIGLDVSDNELAFYLGETWADSGTHYIRIGSSDRNSVSTIVAKRGNSPSAFNGESRSFTGTATRTNCVAAFAIGGKHTNVPETVPYSGAEITYYGIRIFTSSGTLIHHLLPAKSKTTNRAGMYDLITGTFHPSSSDFDDFVTEV